MSLERMKELEEQVKAIPMLQVSLPPHRSANLTHPSYAFVTFIARRAICKQAGSSVSAKRPVILTVSP